MPWFRAPPWAMLCRRAGRPPALGLHCFSLLSDQNITYPTSTLASFLGHRQKTMLGGPVCTSPHQVGTKVLTCHARGPLSLISQLSITIHFPPHYLLIILCHNKLPPSNLFIKPTHTFSYLVGTGSPSNVP